MHGAVRRALAEGVAIAHVGLEQVPQRLGRGRGRVRDRAVQGVRDRVRVALLEKVLWCLIVYM